MEATSERPMAVPTTIRFVVWILSQPDRRTSTTRTTVGQRTFPEVPVALFHVLPCLQCPTVAVKGEIAALHPGRVAELHVQALPALVLQLAAHNPAREHLCRAVTVHSYRGNYLDRQARLFPGFPAGGVLASLTGIHETAGERPLTFFLSVATLDEQDFSAAVLNKAECSSPRHIMSLEPTGNHNWARRSAKFIRRSRCATWVIQREGIAEAP